MIKIFIKLSIIDWDTDIYMRFYEILYGDLQYQQYLLSTIREQVTQRNLLKVLLKVLEKFMV